jgi:ribosomal-protein-alanine N-acetyltransferase
MGWLLAKEYWRRGLATEAATAWLHYGFETLGLDRIVAITRPENIASRGVMEKIGMNYEKDASYYETDCAYYAIDRQQWHSLSLS